MSSPPDRASTSLEDALAIVLQRLEGDARNGFGLHGIFGNVWEWCTVETDDPEIGELTSGYVVCGGSFRSPPVSRRPFFRSILRPERRPSDTGLRPLRALERAGEQASEAAR
jgi:formylglycine-generating enzyme required for sulfatase activity